MKLQPSVLIYDFSEHQSVSRPLVVDGWLRKGGVLLISKDSYAKVVEKYPKLQEADALVLDEAHQCLANRGSNIYKALEGVKTKRRLLLTGTPFQNNALEYYRMVHWMRKEVLDASEAAFEREFAKPINAGMPSDAPPAAVKECELKSAQLKSILSPYVHRKDVSVLRESLPPMQQVILHLRQSKLQSNLYKNLKRYEDMNEITNFLHRYHLSRPIHNHPACLLMQSEDPEEKAVLRDENLLGSQPWWTKFVEKKGREKVEAVNQGPKVTGLGFECVLLCIKYSGSLTLTHNSKKGRNPVAHFDKCHQNRRQGCCFQSMLEDARFFGKSASLAMLDKSC